LLQIRQILALSSHKTKHLKSINTFLDYLSTLIALFFVISHAI